MLRACASFPPCLPLHRTRGQTWDQLTLPKNQRREGWYSDYDDPRHDEAPAERLLEAQLRDADLRGSHERFICDQQRPEVLVVGGEEPVDRDRAERWPR